MKYQKGNYRRGGIGLLIGTLFGLIIAVAFKAPLVALASIAIFGFGGGYCVGFGGRSTVIVVQ